MALVSISAAVERLKWGEVVGLPSETVYGLGGRFDSDPALHKIFSVKQRPFFDPLIVHVATVAEARALTREWPEVYDLLARVFWPGPLTLVAPKAPSVSSLITSGLETVALRCPDHPVLIEILNSLGVAIAAPSANRFGRTSPTTAAHVESEFAGRIPVVDGGPCRVGVESTVLRAELKEEVWQIKVLRPGGVSRAQLRRVLEQAGIRYSITRESSAASPGHLKAHYQPISPVIWLRDQAWNKAAQTLVEQTLGRPIKGAHELRLPATPQAAARELYELFRRHSTDADHVLWICSSPAQEGEDWEAIWDRIERAACLIFP